MPRACSLEPSRMTALEKRKPVSFGLALCGGIILGAFFDNMALGIIIGLLLGFGIVKLPGKPD